MDTNALLDVVREERKAKEEGSEETKEEPKASEEAKKEEPKGEEKLTVKTPEKEESFFQPSTGEEEFSTISTISNAPVEEASKLQVAVADQTFIDGLDEDSQYYMDFAKQAEELMPEKHKGLFAKQLEYLKALRKKTQEIELDPGEELEENEEFVSFVRKNKPNISQRQIKTIENKIAVKTAKEELRGELNEVKERQRLQEVKPQIEKQMKGFESSLIDGMDKSEDLKPILDTYMGRDGEKGGLEAMREKYPEEASALEKAFGTGVSYANSYVKILNGVENYDEKNPSHVNMWGLIEQWGKDLSTKDAYKSSRVKGGKQFATVGEFSQMGDAARGKHWTFSSKQIMQMFQQFTQSETLRAVKQAKENEKGKLEALLKKRGLTLDDLAKKTKSLSNKNDESPRSPASRPNTSHHKTLNTSNPGIVKRVIGGI